MHITSIFITLPSPREEDPGTKPPVLSPCQTNLAKGLCCPKDKGAAVPLMYSELFKLQKSSFSYTPEEVHLCLCCNLLGAGT